MHQWQKDVFSGFMLDVSIRLESAQMSSSGTHISSSQGGKGKKGEVTLLIISVLKFKKARSCCTFELQYI